MNDVPGGRLRVLERALEHQRRLLADARALGLHALASRRARKLDHLARELAALERACVPLRACPKPGAATK